VIGGVLTVQVAFACYACWDVVPCGWSHFILSYGHALSDCGVVRYDLSGCGMWGSRGWG
jgi:hypothetical protein